MDGKNRDPFKEILFDNEFEAPGFPRWGSLPSPTVLDGIITNPCNAGRNRFRRRRGEKNKGRDGRGSNTNSNPYESKTPERKPNCKAVLLSFKRAISRLGLKRHS